MFVTKTEWAAEWGGAKSKENRTPFKSLPFYRCVNYSFRRRSNSSPKESIIVLFSTKSLHCALEEIKIIEANVFVNPYTELDEEEENEKAEKEKNEDKDIEKIGSWYSNPGSGTAEAGVGPDLSLRPQGKKMLVPHSLPLSTCLGNLMMLIRF